MQRIAESGRKSGKRSWWLVAWFALSALLLLGRAWALPTFPPIVEGEYHPKPNGKVAAALKACAFCHVAAGPPKLNPYGLDVQGALKAAGTKTLTPALLHTLDAKDSDGDGVRNGDEIAADYLPGDAASKPAVAPTVVKSTSNAPSTMANASASGFDLGATLKNLILPRHGQHPVLVHFPIALFLIGLLFDALAAQKRDSTLATVGYYNLSVASVSSLLTLATGVWAWLSLYGFNALQNNQTLLIHLLLSMASSALMFGLWRARSKRRERGVGALTRGYFVAAVLCALLVAIGSHLGGNLSGVN